MSTTFRNQVAGLFRACPHQWIESDLLAKVGGKNAWRTRVSECRVDLGMPIANRLRKVGRVTVSEYKFVPASAPVQAGLFEQGAM